MKRSNVARGIFWLAIMFAIGFLTQAESGDRRTSMPDTKSGPPIRILDQNGQPAVNGVPSATSTIFDVTVGGRNGFQFVPSTVNISVGDTVRWTWATSGHSVTSGLPCAADSQYYSPDNMNCASGILSNMGTVYQHTFTQPGTYSYFCASHCVVGMTGVVNVSGCCAPSGWSAGPDLPTPLIRAVGVYFPADGNFYTVGGSTSDSPGSDFQHVLRYSPCANTWTNMSVTLPDNQMNNMACGVLAVSSTPYIYCVGGSAAGAGAATATARVFFYNPLTDIVTTLTAGDDWPGDAAGTILPGGFAVTNDKLYILGGFNINVASTNQIWQFDPTAAIGSKWTQEVNTPEGIMYAPTCSIGGIIYVGGASDYSGGLVIDTTNSFSFNPAIGTIAAIPRATGETRALTFNGLMLVMGGGRVAPNPSNEVNIYDPGTNTWTTGSPVPAFMTARRNFPTDTDGTTRIWLAGGYASDGVTPLSSLEIFCNAAPTPTPTPTPTATATPTPTPTPTPCPTINLSPPTLPNGTVGNFYSHTITASGGTPPYSFMIISGSLPPGLTLISGGVLSGTPTSSGSFTFTIQAHDSHGCPGTRQYSLTVACPTINLSPGALSNGTVGQFYSKTITASGGGTPPFSFMVISGSLPPGLFLASGGVLSGTPTSFGSFTFTIQANDSHGCTGTRQYSLTVACPTISLSPPTLPNGNVFSHYSVTITASGGTPPYSFMVISGSLPPGLTLTSGGVLSGTPTSSGSFTFVIQATDSHGCTGTRHYHVTVLF